MSAVGNTFYYSDPDYPWPGRQYTFQTFGLHRELQEAIEKNPNGVAMVVNIQILGRNFRWSTTSLDIPCEQVHGGKLRFTGKLIGDGEFASTIEILDRLSDIATFSVEVDDELKIGMEMLPDVTAQTAGSYVPPLEGGRVEICLCHRAVDWKYRYVCLYGTLGGASYGADGNTLSFTATSIWQSIDRKVGWSITPAGFDGSDSYGSEGTEIGCPVGSTWVKGYAIGNTEPWATGTGYSNFYVIGSLPTGMKLSTTLEYPVRETDGTGIPLISHGNPELVPLNDNTGSAMVIGVSSSSSEIDVSVTTRNNGWFQYSQYGEYSAYPPSGGKAGGEFWNAGSIGTAFIYYLNRLGSASSINIDYSGAMQYEIFYRHAYGCYIDSVTSVREILEDRLVSQMAGYVSSRHGKYGFSMFPFTDTFSGCPVPRDTLQWGRELLERSTITEVNGDSMTNEFSFEWSYSPKDGEMKNSRMETTNEVNSGNSFWPRTSEAMFGPQEFTALEYPDLRRMYDCRSVARLEEREGGFVFREIEYTCLPSVVRVAAGDIVRIVDEDIGFYRDNDNTGSTAIGKPFIVLEVKTTFRPVVKIRVREWPLAEDFFGMIGYGNSTNKTSTTQG